MENPKCEVLINFMYCDINRFLSDQEKARHYDILFGTSMWRDIATLKEPQIRKLLIYNLYQRQLEEEVRIEIVRSFEMVNKFNQTEYFLFYGTNSIDGLKAMKYAMWKVDPTGTFRFSDRTNPDQTVFFDPKPNYNLLKKLLLKEFSGKIVSIEQIEEFVVIKTPFRETHYKKQILKPMEEEEPPKIKVRGGPGRRKGTYPPGTVIQFL